MNIDFVKKTLLIGLFLFTTGHLFAQTDSLSGEITLRTYLENDNIPLNNEVVYHVQLSWQGDLDAYQIGDIGDPVISNLTLRGSGSTNRLTTDSQGRPMAVKMITFYFKPTSIGMAYIDGVSVQYVHKQTSESETLFAQRLSVKIVEPTEDPKDEFVAGNVLVWVLLIGFLITAIYFGLRYMQRKNKVEETPAEVSLEQKYLDLLSETVHLSNGATRENISSMRKLLNSFIAEKFSIPGNIEKNIVNERLKKLGIQDELLSKIEQMYDKAELAQFAGEQIETTELHLFFDSLEHILKQIDSQETQNSGKKEQV